MTITGVHLANTTEVDFGGVKGTNVTNISDTEITVVAPQSAVGDGDVEDVTVISALGTSQTTGGDQYTYENAPTITSVAPATGPNGGGTTVTITGVDLFDPTAVSFGSRWRSISAPRAPIRSPACRRSPAVRPLPGRAVPWTIRVTTPVGRSPITPSDHFVYNLAPIVNFISPQAGPTAGGTVVTIRAEPERGDLRQVRHRCRDLLHRQAALRSRPGPAGAGEFGGNHRDNGEGRSVPGIRTPRRSLTRGRRP